MDRLDRVEGIWAEVVARQAEGKGNQAILRSELREFMAIGRELLTVDLMPWKTGNKTL